MSEIEFEPHTLLQVLIKQAGAETVSRPRGAPSELPLASLEQLPELFQLRQLDEHHIGVLIKAIRGGGKLDPVTVICIGDRRIIIDGHHRIKAYGAAKVATKVPVRYFEGSLRDAVIEAGRANNKAKLQTTPSEKQDFAWRLICMGGYTKKEVREATGISNGQVGNMRVAMKVLGDEAAAYKQWWQAMEASKGKPVPDHIAEYDEEAYLVALAEGYASKIRKATGSQLTSNPAMLARVICELAGRNAPGVLHAMEMLVPEEYREGYDDDFNDDF